MCPALSHGAPVPGASTERRRQKPARWKRPAAIRHTPPRPPTAPRAKTARANGPPAAASRRRVHRWQPLSPDRAGGRDVRLPGRGGRRVPAAVDARRNRWPTARAAGRHRFVARARLRPQGGPARVQVRRRTRRNRRLDQRSFEPGGSHRPVRRQLGMPNPRLCDAGMEPTGPIGSGRQDRHIERAERGLRRGTPDSHLSSPRLCGESTLQPANLP